MKKFLALIIALVMALSLVACGEQKQPDKPDVPDDGEQQQTASIKVGFITLHDENSTYDLNFINAAKKAIADLVPNEVEALYTNGPAGGCGAVKRTRDIVSVASILVSRYDVKPEAEIFEV